MCSEPSESYIPSIPPPLFEYFYLLRSKFWRVSVKLVCSLVSAMSMRTCTIGLMPDYINYLIVAPPLWRRGRALFNWIMASWIWNVLNVLQHLRIFNDVVYSLYFVLCNDILYIVEECGRLYYRWLFAHFADV